MTEATKAKEIIFRLKQDIRLYESLDSYEDLSELTNEELISSAFVASSFSYIESVYQELKNRFAFLPLKIKAELFESWLLTHKENDLKDVLKIK